MMLFQIQKLHSTEWDVKTIKNGEQGRFGSSCGLFVSIRKPKKCTKTAIRTVCVPADSEIRAKILLEHSCHDKKYGHNHWQ